MNPIKLFIAKYILRFLAYLAIKEYDMENIFFAVLGWFFTIEEEKRFIREWEWTGSGYYDDSVHFPFLNHTIKIENVDWEHDEDGGMLVAEFNMNGKPLCEMLHGLYEAALDDATMGLFDSYDHGEQWWP